jgi:predicted  nucleic acid-binding Zn-ribbon protein
MKAKRAKIKASDVLLIVEQEKMALMQQLDTLKESTGATISDLRDEISSLRDQVTEMRAILRTVMAKQRSQPSSPSKKSLLIEEQYTAEFVSSADEECDDSGSGSD